MNKYHYNEALEYIKKGARVSIGIDCDYVIKTDNSTFMLDNRITDKLRQEGWLRPDPHQGSLVLSDGVPTDYWTFKSVKIDTSEDNADRGYGEGRRMGD